MPGCIVRHRYDPQRCRELAIAIETKWSGTLRPALRGARSPINITPTTALLEDHSVVWRVLDAVGNRSHAHDAVAQRHVVKLYFTGRPASKRRVNVWEGCSRCK
jgi:hypothetical protein